MRILTSNIVNVTYVKNIIVLGAYRSFAKKNDLTLIFVDAIITNFSNNRKV